MSMIVGHESTSLWSNTKMTLFTFKVFLTKCRAEDREKVAGITGSGWIHVKRGKQESKKVEFAAGVCSFKGNDANV